MIGRVDELAATNEPALRAHCQEVSRQTDTSSLCLQREGTVLMHQINAVMEGMMTLLQKLSQSLAQNTGVFRTRDGKSDFPSVCRAVVRIEEERQRLLVCVAELSQLRLNVASQVAEANRGLHILSLAKHAVPKEVRPPYEEAIHSINAADERLKVLDAKLCELQKFVMILVERHLSVFVQRLRAAADFNHAGEALDRAAILSLCVELSILLGRAPNVSF